LLNNNIEIRAKEDNLCKLGREMKKVLFDLDERQQNVINRYIEENDKLTGRYL